ncbi:hypothetical protein B0H21DRAFT_872010 [Amylocystis lapponica]|nr:hypothetical protein B0H21DRAFT_872010 [Amylocystis lapponica]
MARRKVRINPLPHETASTSALPAESSLQDNTSNTTVVEAIPSQGQDQQSEDSSRTRMEELENAQRTCTELLARLKAAEEKLATVTASLEQANADARAAAAEHLRKLADVQKLHQEREDKLYREIERITGASGETGLAVCFEAMAPRSNESNAEDGTEDEQEHINNTDQNDDTPVIRFNPVLYSPLPYEPPDRSKIRTLLDLLLVSLPDAPPVYSAKALKRTKKISEAEITLPRDQQLEKVVYLPGLVSQLFGTVVERLLAIKMRWDDPDFNRAIAHLHPWDTMWNQPKKIFSEADAVDRAKTLLFRPAMAAVEAVATGELGHDHEREYPYISSCPHGKVIPDGMVVRAENDKVLDVAVTIEIKAPTVLQGVNGKGKFHDILQIESDDQIGRAMKFNWPDVVPKNNDQTRMMMQAWTQIVDRKTRLGALSSSEASICMARGEGADKNTLFLSPPYGPRDRPLLATFCWLAIAEGIMSIEDLNLPKADIEWWGDEI